MKHHLTWVAALMVAVALGAPGCSDDDNPMGTGDSVAISVAVGSGATPSYTWAGAGVFSVTVVRTAEPLIPVWGVVTPGADDIASPVTHGTVPAGSVATATAETMLTMGVAYRVTVSRLDDMELGFTDFTP